MKRLKYTLISDGPTDAILIPIINWALKKTGGVELANGVCAEFWRLPNPPNGLTARMLKAVELYPCEVLFVHRDAEKDSPQIRSAEIRAAVTNAQASGFQLPVVTVIPIRMVEAWLLFDERAIRHAAGNPSGRVKLNLPSLQNVESRPDPKRDLRLALQTASELRGRRLKKFHTLSAFWSVVDHLDDFTPLRQLSGFLAFERTVCCIRDNQWQPQFYGLD
jgi:hypothetical protein